jgi:hypothetical protein
MEEKQEFRLLKTIPNNGVVYDTDEKGNIIIEKWKTKNIWNKSMLINFNCTISSKKQ